MNMSPTLSALATALSQLCGELSSIAKTKTVQVKSDKGSYSYRYAELADVLEAVKPSLLKLGLAVHQAPETLEGKTLVTTTVLHSSGEFISSSLALPVAGNTAQAHGSAITFARRYALLAALNLATEDDDGVLSAIAPARDVPAIPPAPRALETAEDELDRADLYRRVCQLKGKTSPTTQNAFISSVLSGKTLEQLEEMLTGSGFVERP